MEIKTVSLQGKQYAPVGERIKAFHKELKGSITSECTFQEGWVYFKATVSILNEDGEYFTYNGHSFGKVDKEKALEKLETVAVGRALAFAGFAPDGSIASAEEMEKFHGNS